MLTTELKNAFPFYWNIKKQHRFREQNKGMTPFGLPVPNNKILPFQIIIESANTIVTPVSLKVFEIDTLLPILDLSAEVSKLELQTRADNQAAYITYKDTTLSTIMPYGLHYIVLECDIVFGGGAPVNTKFYSEVFEVLQNTSKLTTISWWNTYDIEPLLYQTGFKNIVYLNTYTEAIPPSIIQEGYNNNEGEFISNFQRFVQKHKLEFFAPDYLQDALSILPMHSNIVVTENLEDAPIFQPKLQLDYGENYCGTCKLEFELSTKYIKTGCSKNILLV